PGGGTLRLTLHRIDGSVVAEIQDSGGGIPAEVQDKIFNLYFTTKKAGSGIGLPMTYRIMQLHQGSVEFESEEHIGTKFRLALPLVARQVENPPAVAVND